MQTRIFKVEYSFVEKCNGKHADPFREFKTVAAKNALDAISKVEAANKKPFIYTDEETKKKNTITRHEFEAISVSLVAETDL